MVKEFLTVGPYVSVGSLLMSRKFCSQFSVGLPDRGKTPISTTGLCNLPAIQDSANYSKGHPVCLDFWDSQLGFGVCKH